jgi:hypothetical protein
VAEGSHNFTEQSSALDVYFVLFHTFKAIWVINLSITLT